MGAGVDLRATADDRKRWRTLAEEREWASFQKAALIVMHLFVGEGMRTCDVADLMGVNGWHTADRAMTLLQAAIPAIQRDSSGFWYMDHAQLSS